MCAAVKVLSSYFGTKAEKAGRAPGRGYCLAAHLHQAEGSPTSAMCQRDALPGTRAASPANRSRSGASTPSACTGGELTGSSNPRCWYPGMAGHERGDNKIAEAARRVAGLAPGKTIREGSVRTSRARAPSFSGRKCCCPCLYECYVPFVEGCTEILYVVV